MRVGPFSFWGCVVVRRSLVSWVFVERWGFWLVIVAALASWFLAGDAWAAGAHKSNTKYVAQQTASGRADIVPAGTSDDLANLLNKPGRWHTAEPATGSSVLRDLLDKPFRPVDPGADFDIFTKRKVTPAMTARAVARALPGIGTAIVVAEFIEATGCKFNPQAIAIECEGDFQAEPAGEFVYRLNTNGQYYQSSGEAVAAEVRRINEAVNTPLVGGSVSRGTCTAGAVVGPWTNWTCVEVNRWAKDCPTCPAYSMPDNPNHAFQVGKFTPVQAGVTTAQGCEFELMPDGSCAMRPDEDEWADKVENSPEAKGKAPNVPPFLDEVGVDYETTPPVEVGGPSVAPGGRIVEQTNPDGSTTTVDRDWLMTYSPPGSANPWYGWTPRDITRTTEPNVPPAPYEPPDSGTGTPGGPSGGTTTVTTAQGEDLECGLPGFPPCKIDESGTPAPEVKDTAADAEGVFADLKACVLSPSTCLPELPSLNWSFALPTSCSVIHLPQYAPALTQIDVCQFQPVFHDIMGVFWAFAGLVGAIRMVFSDAVGGGGS